MTDPSTDSGQSPHQESEPFAKGPLTPREKRILVEGGAPVPIPGLIPHLDRILAVPVTWVDWINTIDIPAMCISQRYNCTMRVELRRNEVLAEAVRRVQAALDLTNEQLLAVLKIRTMEELNASNEAGKRAAILVRIFQRLYAFVDGNNIAMRHWISTESRSLGARPLNLMSEDIGLYQVLDYLDLLVE